MIKNILNINIMEISLFQTNILDNRSNNIKYYYTKVNNYYVIHIHNPNFEKIIINKNNRSFFSKLVTMMYNKDKKSGCFNHEINDNNSIYNMKLQDIINNSFIKYYLIILVDNIEPLSFLSLSNDNMIYSVCTNILYRNQGHMSKLMSHILKLIKLNKLKIDFRLKGLKLTILKKNPIKDSLIKFYNRFNFEIINELYDYYILEYKI